jgi:hypothetical protein
MTCARVSDSTVPLTSNGTTGGFIGVDIDTVVYPGTAAILYSTAAGSLPVYVVSCDDSGNVGLRKRQDPNIGGPNLGYPTFGMTDVSAYLVSDGAVLFIPQQIVPVAPNYRPLPNY